MTTTIEKTSTIITEEENINTDINDIDIDDAAYIEEAEKFEQEKKEVAPFIAAISAEWVVEFLEDKVKLYLHETNKDEVIPGIKYDEGNHMLPVTYEIGYVFDAIYTYLRSMREQHLAETTEEFKNNITKKHIVYDLNLLDIAVRALENPNDVRIDFVDQLNTLCYSEIAPIYGCKVKLLHKNFVRDKFNEDDKAFLRYLRCVASVDTIYECANLFQVCGAILDYLSNYEYTKAGAKKRYALKRCERCGRYFITDNRRIKYCKNINEAGKTCAYMADLEYKKIYILKGGAKKDPIDEKIANRLKHYKASADNSIYISEAEKKIREEMYQLYLKNSQEYRKMAYKQGMLEEYKNWLKEAASLLPTKHGEYNKFYSWLRGKE